MCRQQISTLIINRKEYEVKRVDIARVRHRRERPSIRGERPSISRRRIIRENRGRGGGGVMFFMPLRAMMGGMGMGMNIGTGGRMPIINNPNSVSPQWNQPMIINSNIHNEVNPFSPFSYSNLSSNQQYSQINPIFPMSYSIYSQQQQYNQYSNFVMPLVFPQHQQYFRPTL